MKCNNVVQYGWYAPTKKPAILLGYAPNGELSKQNLDYLKKAHPNYILGEAKKCDGDIVAEVSAVDEPYGLGADLSVEFKCNKCGYMPDGLPTGEHSLNEFLNKILEDM